MFSLGRKNQAAHNMLNIAFLQDERQHLLLDLVGTTAPWTAQTEDSQRSLSQRLRGNTSPSGQDPGAWAGCGLGWKDEDLSAEHDMQASFSPAKEPAPPQNLGVVLARQQWALTGAGLAGLKEQQMCRANLRGMLAQPRTAEN